MSQCTDVDAALKRLGDKIDAQNKRIEKLEAAANNAGGNGSSGGKKQAGQPFDPSLIYTRLSNVEEDMGIIVNFLESLRPILKAVSKLPLFNILIGGE